MNTDDRNAEYLAGGTRWASLLNPEALGVSALDPHRVRDLGERRPRSLRSSVLEAIAAEADSAQSVEGEFPKLVMDWSGSGRGS